VPTSFKKPSTGGRLRLPPIERFARQWENAMFVNYFYNRRRGCYTLLWLGYNPCEVQVAGFCAVSRVNEFVWAIPGTLDPTEG
jgi:hypothetical protein